MQKDQQLGKAGLITLISILSAAPPIATDLFLPAVPDMPAYFNTSEAVINLVLLGFYFFMSIGMLILGPLSDKYGRRPVALASLFMFIIPSALCAVTPNIWLLIAERVVQGLGGGGMVALGTALVKDCFDGDDRTKVLTVTMAIGSVAPMAAPVLGAVILSFTTWQGTFIAQAVVGICALPLVFALKEPLSDDERVTESILHTLGRLVVVGKNPSFIWLLLLFCLFGGSYMGYVSSASYIYTDFFAMGKIEYSIFFAINSFMAVIGSMLVSPIQRRFNPKYSLAGVFVAGAIAGALVLFIGSTGPVAFLVAYAIYTIGIGFIRPSATAVLLEQQARDTGSASSLINMFYALLGSIGMAAITLPWASYIQGLGFMICGCSIVALIGWVVLLKSPVKMKGVN